MYTRCPNCQQQQTVTTEQLSIQRGIAYCRYCAVKFDALELLSDTSLDAATRFTATLPWESPKDNSRRWAVGVVAGIALLMAQIVYFEGAALSRQPKIRPSLEAVCRALGCHLPDYRNLDEWLLQATLTPDGQHYAVTAALINQAAYAQPYPGIKIELLDVNGRPFAERIFRAEDYLPDDQRAATAVKAGAALSIQLPIAATRQLIAGHTFELVY